MPVIATTTLMEATGIELGDEVQVAVQTGGATGWIDTTFLITQVVDYFPTALSDDNGTLIVDANLLLPYLNANSHNVSVTNEWLIPPEAGAAAQPLLPAANQVWDAAAIQQLLDAQALGLGLRSVASIGYWLATILTLAGIGTAFYFGARQQQASYGVLRAIGLSSRQLFATLLLEQVILILIGMLLGTILGILLARLTLVSLAPTLGGLGLLPPFQVLLDPAAIGQVYLLLLPALALVLGGGVWLLHRQQLHRLIRVGDIE
jgi:putative ABC transport system permease protein